MYNRALNLILHRKIKRKELFLLSYGITITLNKSQIFTEITDQFWWFPFISVYFDGHDVIPAILTLLRQSFAEQQHHFTTRKKYNAL